MKDFKKMDKKSIKVALLFSGQPRFFDSRSFDSIKQHLLDVYDCDVFCHFWWDGKGEGQYDTSPWNELGLLPMQSNVDKQIAELYAPVALQYEPPLDRIPKDDTANVLRPTNGYIIRSMYTSLQRSYELFAASKTKEYDFVCRLRYDFYIDELPDLSMYIDSNIDLIAIDKGKYEYNKFTNEIWFCKPYIAPSLFAIANELDRFTQQEVFFNDEELFTAYIKELNVNVVYLQPSLFFGRVPYKNRVNPHFQCI